MKIRLTHYYGTLSKRIKTQRLKSNTKNISLKFYNNEKHYRNAKQRVIRCVLRGADLEEEFFIFPRTIIHIMCISTTDNTLFRFIIVSGAKINDPMEEYRPLPIAINGGYFTSAKLLVESGADLKVPPVNASLRYSQQYMKFMQYLREN